MQPIRLVIPGDFWDSQIYRGRLYLTAMDASVAVYDWDSIVEYFIRDARDRLPVTCALSRGDYLYQGDWGLVFDDPDMKPILVAKFSSLASKPLEIPANELDARCIGQTTAPWGLADDADLYGNRLYAATQSGLIRAEIRARKTRKNKTGIGKTEKFWDGLGLSVSIRRGGDLAVAAGSDGLHEFTSLQESFKKLERRQVSERHTRLVSYAYASIYGSSDRSGGYLAAYGWQGEGNDRVRTFIATVDSTEIFNANGGMSWANQEKLYLSAPGRVEVVRYRQGYMNDQEEGRSPFTSLGSIEIPASKKSSTTKRRVLGGGVAFFGTILEHDDGLLVLQSDKQHYAIQGPLTRWRVFPRSHRYENHLHVVLDDRIEIYSFNHDYFVPQKGKLAGIEYTSPPSWAGGVRRGLMN
jgi:hypothetical protein